MVYFWMKHDPIPVPLVELSPFLETFILDEFIVSIPILMVLFFLFNGTNINDFDDPYELLLFSFSPNPLQRF